MLNVQEYAKIFEGEYNYTLADDVRTIINEKFEEFKNNIKRDLDEYDFPDNKISHELFGCLVYEAIENVAKTCIYNICKTKLGSDVDEGLIELIIKQISEDIVSEASFDLDVCFDFEDMEELQNTAYYLLGDDAHLVSMEIEDADLFRKIDNIEKDPTEKEFTIIKGWCN